MISFRVVMGSLCKNTQFSFTTQFQIMNRKKHTSLSCFSNLLNQPSHEYWLKSDEIIDKAIAPAATVEEVNKEAIEITNDNGPHNPVVESSSAEPATAVKDEAEEKLIIPESTVAEETESESSGYRSFETDNGSGEEDLSQTDTADFDEVYMDGKVFMIRKEDNVNRNRMIRRIPGLSWEETFVKKKIALANLFKGRTNGKKKKKGWTRPSKG
ncbi:unnamed protein product [Cuscuta epithymum]|uniref:Uncharacterized protein n=1 Tax=Cuscuta epithymum TaxID=186058 RepID=A0AAV0DKC6_9ASTE|nr:unnamed protein product [Cuscuta epithymum]